MLTLHKPARRQYDQALVQAYTTETDGTIYVESSNPCLACHLDPHSSLSVSVSIGPAIATPFGSVSLMVDQEGNLIGTASFTSPSGLQGTATILYDPTTGPDVVVVGGGGELTLTDPLQTYSALPDNTRTSP